MNKVDKLIASNITDLDLPPARRSLANLWQAEYFKALIEVRNANKGIKRLKKRVAQLESRLKAAGIPLHERKEKAKAEVESIRMVPRMASE
jgi:hypothetical protein